MLEPFLVLLPVALLVPSGPSPVRLPWSSLLTWRLLYATVGHHAGKVLGTVVAHDGRVVPPGRDTRAEEEPEYAGGAAVEKDVLIWVHDGEGSMVGPTGFIAGLGRWTTPASGDGSARCRGHLQSGAVGVEAGLEMARQLN